jgi:hypothetical protein
MEGDDALEHTHREKASMLTRAWKMVFVYLYLGDFTFTSVQLHET